MTLPALTKREPCIGGFTLLISSIIWMIVRIDNVDIFDIDTGVINTQDQVTKFHEIILNNKEQLIMSAIGLWSMLPLIMIHIYCIQRIYDKLFQKDLIMIDFLKFLYIRSWIIKMVIVCVIYSPTLIVASYFDWTFTDQSEIIYTGYYIQLLCIHYVIILGDAVLIASGL